MNNAPYKLRKKWAQENADGIVRVCMRADEGNCKGRITKEHAIRYNEKSLQEDWAILDICAYHHGVDQYQDGGGMNKEKHIWIALSRATPERLKELSKAEDKLALLYRLNKKYGTYQYKNNYEIKY